MGKPAPPDLESGQPRTPIPYWTMLLDQGVLIPEVEQKQYDGTGTEEDPFVVVWLENDPRNPFTWSAAYRWSMSLSLSFATMVVAFCSSAYAGGIPGIIEQYHTSQEVATLGLSLYVLGFALGPLIWAPFSELYGRQIVFFFCFGAFTAFNGGVTAAQNIWSIIILRFFAGCFASAPLTNAGGVVADIFQVKERGLAVTFFGSCVFLGPSLGPVVSGFLAESAGWRWVMGFMCIFSAVVWLQCALILPETYAPTLLRKRAAALSKKTGKVYRSKPEIDRGPIQTRQIFKTSMSRPWVLLFREPIVLLLTTYLAIIYGTLYMFFGAYPIVYQRGRGWSEGIGGLAFIGILIGMLLSLAYAVFYDNRRYMRLTEKGKGATPPEARLPAAMVGGIALPIGLFWFAWTNSPGLPWAASVAAGIPFGFGMVLVFLSVFTYLIDSYVIFAASALAANSILRSIFGAVFPLFTTYMYDGIGIHWATTIPAFLALICAPFPFIFYKYGESIRMKCTYALEADLFMRRLRGEDPPAPPSEDKDTRSESLEEKEEGYAASSDGGKNRKNSELEKLTTPPDTATTPTAPRFDEHAEGEDQYEKETEAWVEANSRSRPRVSRRRTPRAEQLQSKQEDYEHSPFDIDRVNTKESFRSGSRSRSRAGSSRVGSRAVSRTTSRHR